MKLITQKDNPAKKAGEMIGWLLCKYEDRPVLLMLSGGSAFEVLQYVDRSMLEKSITITMVDERFTTERDINNFAKLTGTDFFDRARSRGCAFIGTEVQKNETITELTDQLERHVEGWKRRNKDGIVIALLGIGADGHIAGIMPYPENKKLFSELFDDTDKWVVGYDAGAKNEHPMRVTITASFLKNIVDHAVVYAAGEKKKEAILKAREGGPVNEVPARVLKEMKSVALVTDQEI